jgi:co-chaperonin GroES (HSP10)
MKQIDPQDMYRIDGNKVQMVFDHVLIKPKKEETTASGIIMVEEVSVENRTDKGEIIAIGDDVVNYKVGDLVRFPIHVGIDFDFLDGYYMIVTEDSLLGVEEAF